MFKIPQCFLFLTFLIFYNCVNLKSQSNCKCPLFNDFEKEVDKLIYSDNKSNILKKIDEPTLQSRPICHAQANVFKTLHFFNAQQIDSTERYLRQAEQLLQQNNCSEDAFYVPYLLYLKLYYQKQDYNTAINYGYKALGIAENTQSNDRQGEILANIARIYVRMQQYDKSVEYSRRALGFIKKIPPSVKKAVLLEMLTHSYNAYRQIQYSYVYNDYKTTKTDDEISKIFVELSKKDKILDTIRQFATESKELGQQFGHKPTLVKAYRYLQTVEMSIDNNDKALIYIDSSLMYCRQDLDYSGLFAGYGDKADIYWKLKNFSEAKRFADSCLFYAQKTGIPLSMANAYMTVSYHASELKDFKSAYYALREAKFIMDSVQNLERTEVVNELEKKYNQAKNEKTIKELAQEKRIYLLLALAALLGIVIFLFYVRQQSLKHKQTILETEQRLNRARMNPHFFFNALTSLQSFALRENDGKALATNISKFSHIMRETLESTYKEYVTIEQEIDFLNEYLEIQRIRYPKKFTYQIEAADDLEIDELLIPAMILQPFVENSIEHGFSGLEHEGYVSVFFKKENQEVLIEINDNGKGLVSGLKIQNEHISRASQIIKDRIYLLNIKLKTKARFSIDNRVGENGVCVKIYLPIIYQN